MQCILSFSDRSRITATFTIAFSSPLSRHRLSRQAAVKPRVGLSFCFAGIIFAETRRGDTFLLVLTTIQCFLHSEQSPTRIYKSALELAEFFNIISRLHFHDINIRSATFNEAHQQRGLLASKSQSDVRFAFRKLFTNRSHLQFYRNH